jgi:carbonic anhydrase
MLFMVVFSSALVQASPGCGCGSDGGWHYLQRANKSFIKNRKYIKQRAKTANGQNPAFVVLSCADSRTPPELIFNQGLGRIFCPRVAGNTAGDQVIDSIAFAVKTWDVTTVVVMGHESCGAVIGALDHLRANGGVIDPENGIFNAVLIPIEKAILAAGIDIYGPNALEESIEANVVYAANQLLTKSTIISNAVNNGQIIIVGSVYSLKTGKARQLFIIDNC